MPWRLKNQADEVDYYKQILRNIELKEARNSRGKLFGKINLHIILKFKLQIFKDNRFFNEEFQAYDQEDNNSFSLANYQKTNHFEENKLIIKLTYLSI